MKQTLSIGKDCDHISFVEHEFLHALGFLHEQSRYDREDYITINWKNVVPGDAWFQTCFSVLLAASQRNMKNCFPSSLHTIINAYFYCTLNWLHRVHTVIFSCFLVFQFSVLSLKLLFFFSFD